MKRSYQTRPIRWQKEPYKGTVSGIGRKVANRTIACRTRLPEDPKHGGSANEHPEIFLLKALFALFWLVALALALAAATLVGAAIWAGLYAYRVGISQVDALIEQDPGLALLVILAGMAITAAAFAMIAVSGWVVARLGRHRTTQPASFPAIEPHLLVGSSPVFDVEVRGENLLVSFGKPRQKFTFVQEVRVAAPSYQAACPRAIEMVSCDKTFRASLQNTIDDLPRLYINSIEQVNADPASEFVGEAAWAPESALDRLSSILDRG